MNRKLNYSVIITKKHTDRFELQFYVILVKARVLINWVFRVNKHSPNIVSMRTVMFADEHRMK